MDTLTDYLRDSGRILALVGAGLSAPSGISTFHNIQPVNGYTYASLASVATFDEKPDIVWNFHEDMRRTVLRAQPNRAHQALVELAQAKPQFLTISQNIDGKRQTSQAPEHYADVKQISRSALVTWKTSW